MWCEDLLVCVCIVVFSFPLFGQLWTLTPVNSHRNKRSHNRKKGENTENEAMQLKIYIYMGNNAKMYSTGDTIYRFVSWGAVALYVLTCFKVIDCQSMLCCMSLEYTSSCRNSRLLSLLRRVCGDASMICGYVRTLVVLQEADPGKSCVNMNSVKDWKTTMHLSMQHNPKKINIVPWANASGTGNPAIALVGHKNWGRKRQWLLWTG
jgi:hypothetical protein